MKCRFVVVTVIVIRVSVSLQLPLRAHSTKSEQTKTVSTQLVARGSAITYADSLLVKYYSQLAIFQAPRRTVKLLFHKKEVSQKEDCVLSLQYIVNCHSLYRAPLRPRRNKALTLALLCVPRMLSAFPMNVTFVFL